MAIRVSNVTAQALINPSTVIRSVTDTLDFQQETEKRSLLVSNVTFQALIPAVPAFGRIPYNELTLQQQVFELLVVGDRNPVTDTIVFEQSVFSPSFPHLEDAISFSDEAISSIKNAATNQVVQFADAAIGCLGLPWVGISVQDTIAFIHYPGRAYLMDVEDDLGLSNTTYTVGAVTQELNFQQYAYGGVGYDLISDLGLSGLITTQSDLLQSVTHANVVKHSFTYFIDSPCYRKQYQKFEGEGQDTTPFPDARLSFKADFVIETLSGTKQQLVLRSPEPDDRDRLAFNRINRESRGGELSVFSDPAWAKVNTLLFTIVALKPDKITSLQQFLLDTLGQEVMLQDWTGSTWTGVVTTPGEAATEDRDGWWTFSFEFEGTPWDGSGKNHELAISDSVGFTMDYVRPLEDTIVFNHTVTVGGDINVDTITDTILFSESLDPVLVIPMILDDFSGSGNIDGQSADLGGTWSANASFQAGGTMSSGIDSGAYMAFSPQQGTTYACEWHLRNISQVISGDNREVRAFLSETKPSTVTQGNIYDGTEGVTCCKAGFVIKGDSGTQSNAARLGDSNDGVADTVEFTDATLRAEGTDIDLRLILDTTAGAGGWTATFYAKLPASGSWTQVRGEVPILDETIGGIGMSCDNTSSTFEIVQISVNEERAI